MTINQIVEKFIANPATMKMGAGKLAIRYKSTVNDIYAARDIARKQLYATGRTNADMTDNNENVTMTGQEYPTSTPVSYQSEGVIEVTIMQDDTPEPFVGGDPNNVLVIGDTHEPFTKLGYLEFCREMQEKYNCGTVVHIGDLVDNHAISYHEHDPSGKSAGDEYNLAMAKVQRWYRTFPNVKICIGNHDALPFRKAFTAGLPSYWLKSYQELLQSPKTWEWDFVHYHNGVIFQHGTGMSGEMASINAARENRQSTVIGHLHTVCNTRYLASQKDLIFGCSVGCGIDHKAYAFAYGKEQTRKPVLSCAVILNGTTPINIPMTI